MALDTWLIRASGQDNLLSGAYGATLAHADFGPTPTGSFGTNFRRFQCSPISTNIYYFQVLNPNTGSIPLIPCRNPANLEIASDVLKSSGTIVVTGSTSGATASLTFGSSAGIHYVQTGTFVNDADITDDNYIMNAAVSNKIGTFLSGESLISTDSTINNKKISNSAWGGAQLAYGRKIILQCLVRIPVSVDYFGFGFWSGLNNTSWPTLYSVVTPSSTPVRPQIGFTYYGAAPSTKFRGDSNAFGAGLLTTWDVGMGITEPNDWMRLRIVLNENQKYYAETGDRISYTNSIYIGDSSDTPTWTLVDTSTSQPPAGLGTTLSGYYMPGFYFQTNDTSGYVDIDQIEVLVEDTDVGITNWS